MPPPPPPPTPHNLRRAVLPCLAALALALGAVGYARAFALTGVTHSVADVLYAAIRLFLFDSDSLVDPPWQLDVARFLAPAVAAWSAVLAVSQLFGERLDDLRLQRSRRHVVICGLGAKGEHLANEFLDARQRVVVIEADADVPAIARLRTRGALVLIGESNDLRVLQKARVGEAAIVVAVCGLDEINVATAVHVRDLAREAKRGAGDDTGDDRVRCFVHVVDAELGLLLQRNHAFDSDRGCTIRLFDAYAIAARKFLANHPLEGAAGTDSAAKQAHLIIAGFGLMGQRLALQAIRVGHFANLRPLRVTVIDRDGEAVRRRLLWNFPLVDKACELDVIHGEIGDPQVLRRLEADLTRGDKLCTFAVCLDDDGKSLAAALRLRTTLAAAQDAVAAGDSGPGRNAVRLAVRLTAEGELGRLLAGPAAGTSSFATASSADIVVLGTHAQSCGSKELLGDELDTLAQAVHAAYVEKRLAEGKPAGDLTMRPWHELAPDLQDSNRQQADHIPVKLRAVGCRVAKGTSSEPFRFTDDEVETLAKMEHARWVADRVLAGWAYAPGPKDAAARRSPYLVPWADLTEEVREWDREPVRNIPALLGHADCHVQRMAP